MPSFLHVSKEKNPSGQNLNAMSFLLFSHYGLLLFATLSTMVSLLLMNHWNNSVLGNLWILSCSLGCHRHIKREITQISPPKRWLLCRFTFLSHTTSWYITLLLNFPRLSPKPQGCSTTLFVYPLGPWWSLCSCWPWKVHQSNEAGCESMYMGVWDREDGLIELRDGLFPPAGAVKQQVDAIIRAGRWGEGLFTAGLAWPGSICCPV